MSDASTAPSSSLPPGDGTGGLPFNFAPRDVPSLDDLFASLQNGTLGSAHTATATAPNSAQAPLLPYYGMPAFGSTINVLAEPPLFVNPQSLVMESTPRRVVDYAPALRHCTTQGEERVTFAVSVPKDADKGACDKQYQVTVQISTVARP